MKSVFVTSNIPRAGLELLEEEFEIVYHTDLHKQISEEELVQAAKTHHGFITLLSDPITERVALAGKEGSLEVVANYAVGYDNIDVDACKKHGIQVTNTPGVLTKTTADLAFALLLAFSRRLREAETYLRDGQFKRWEPDLLLGEDVHSNTLGIIGIGQIGQEVAKRARGFDMDILYYDQNALPREKESALGATYNDLDDLLTKSDYITLHVPLTNETHHLISNREFDRMKDTAVIINTARGPVIDESALVYALEQGKIKGAALDVYEEEPTVHPGLMNRDDCLLVPHIGSATKTCRDEMARLACQNARAVLRGEEPITPVN